MTSADFRHDYGAHVENMRLRQKDQQHLQFFQSIIEDNRHLFEGRSILVLSCGPGTLALMAARAGAAHVYAIDYSNVTDYAQLVVKENHYEHVITVLHGRVTDLKLTKQLLVDGIICNWMGHCLLYESELVQVLQARELWLKPDGFILPDLGALYLMGGSNQLLKNERCNWWLDVYGCKMNAMRRYSMAEPRYAKVKGDQLLTLARKVMSLDLRTATMEDLQLDCDIRLQALHEGYFECFVLYFDVTFSRGHLPQKLSCNPWLGSQLKSLWLQTVLFVEQPFIMRAKYNYTGHLVFKPLKQEEELSRLNLNEMKIQIEFFEATPDGGWNPRVRKSWLMLPRFQTVQEVTDCQDQQFRLDL
ncbi:protein arginine N-methyltransferase 1 [Drosophila innubila]|uniref:protein arginine N-methyltransferase 1 n=1 Tax=Drosophila innubila TaxID=198719 RepID=UPI00148BE126|nr:protein arginine N-methyltransferase 1 [Drosophila innubila]